MMKHTSLITIISVSLLCTSCAVEQKKEENNAQTDSHVIEEQISDSLYDFSINSFSSLLEPNENLLYSPLPDYTAFSQSMCDAKAETKEELLTLLHFTGDKDTLLSQLSNVLASIEQQDILHSANSIWYSSTLQISKNLLDCADKLKTQLLQKDFQKEDIGQLSKQWIDQELERSDTPKPLITTDTPMIYLSTLHFKDRWRSPFYKEQSKKQDFHINETTRVSTMFMHQTYHDIAYRDHAIYEAIALPFDNGCLMNLYLPKEHHSVEEMLALPDWMQPISSNHNAVQLSLPSFSQSQQGSLKSALQKQGVKRAFSQQLAQFSSTDKNQPIFIGDVLQGVNLVVNEDGVEVAAYEELLFTTGAALQKDEIIELSFDHPFLYVITSPEGIPLFMGYLQNPAA